jgi:predicted CXXCH cytochrome family protein
MPATAQLMLLITALATQPASVAPRPRDAARAATSAEHPPVTGSDGAACITCHVEVTAARVVHGPVAAGNCSTCHVVGISDGRRRVTLTGGASTRNTATLCVACHKEFDDRPGPRHRHAPVAAGDCTACHDPHGSPFRFQLPADGNGACVTCHKDIGEALAQPHAHAPAVASCQICHDPHAAEHPSQLRASGNTMCLACHADAPVKRTVVDAAVLFGRHRPDSFDRLVASGSRILLDASLVSGHPTTGHPVDARPDPSRKGQTLGCASCHNPHGSAGGKLLRFGATGVSSLCIKCHAF